MKQIAIYALGNKDNPEQSIEAQVTLCRRYALANGYEVVRVYKDIEGLSRLTERLALKCLLADLKKGLYDYVLVTDIGKLPNDLIKEIERR